MYEIVSLVALIKTAVDENTPNGQLEPGRVVPRKDGKKGYFVYIGVRRYLALRWLLGHTRDARFAVFHAYVDTGLTDLQMFLRAKMENEDGKGERQGLSVLEEIFGLSQIKDSLSTEKLKDGELRRLYDLSSKLPQGRLKKLYDIERRTLSRFTIPQLERLVAVREEKDFFLTAASTSGFRFKEDDLEKAEQGREAAYTLEWFKDVFPEYASAAPRAARPPVQQQPDGEQQGGHLEVDEQAVILAPCPACSARSMVHAEGHMETRDIPPDPEEATVTSVAKTIGQNDRRCWKCGQRFYALVRHLEGRKYAADTTLSDEFREPQTVVEAIDVRYDRTGKVWQQIVDGKIAGTVDLSGGGTGAGEEGGG